MIFTPSKRNSLLICLLGTCLNFSIQAQVFNHYFTDSSYNQLSVEGFQKLDFQWSLPAAAQVEMNEGMNSIDEGNYDNSIEHFNKVLTLDKNFAPAYYYRGISNKILHQLGAANYDINKAALLLPDRPEVYMELGDIHYLKSDLPRSEEYYKMALKVKPNYAPAYVRLGMLSAIKGEFNQAIKYYEFCIEINPRFPDSYLAIAILKFTKNHKNPEAFEFYAKAIHADSAFAQVYFWRGLSYLTLKENEKGIRDWNRAVELQPANSLYTLLRGLALAEIGSFDEAYRDMRRTISKHPVDERRNKFIHSNFERQVDAQSVVNYFSRLGHGLDSAAFQHLKKGFCLLYLNHVKNAMASIIESQKVQESSCAYYLKGLAFEYLGKGDSAISCYSNVLKLDPNMYDANKKLAIHKYRQKDWQGAFLHLKEMERIQPDYEGTWRLRGIVKAGLGDYKGANADLTRYLIKDSLDIDAIKTRGNARYGLADYEGSNEDYYHAFKLNPKQSNLLLAISRNYFNLGDTAKALTTLVDAKKKFSQNIQVRIMLTDAWIETRFFESAEVEIAGFKSMIATRSGWSAAIDFLTCKLLAKKGQINKSLRMINELITKYRDDEYIFFRAKLYLQANKIEAAKEDLKKLKEHRYATANDLFVKYNIR